MQMGQALILATGLATGVFAQIEANNARQDNRGTMVATRSYTREEYHEEYEDDIDDSYDSTNYPSALDAIRRNFGDEIIRCTFPNDDIRKNVLEHLLTDALDQNQITASCLEARHVRSLVRKTRGWPIRRIINNFEDIISQDLARQIYAQHLEEQRAARSTSTEDNQETSVISLPTTIISENTHDAQVSEAGGITIQIEQGDAPERFGAPIRVSGDSLLQGFDRLNYRTWREIFSGWWNRTKIFCRENPALATTSAILGLFAVNGAGPVCQALYDKYGFDGRRKRAKDDLNLAQTYLEDIQNIIATSKLNQEFALELLSHFRLRISDPSNYYPALIYALDRFAAKISFGWRDIVDGKIPNTTNLCDLSVFQPEIDKLGL